MSRHGRKRGLRRRKPCGRLTAAPIREDPLTPERRLRGEIELADQAIADDTGAPGQPYQW